MLSEVGFTGLIPLHEVSEAEMPRVAQFKCGSESLDSFLQSEARDHYLEHLSQTSVIFHEDFAGLVGYVTLTNDAIALDISEVGHLGMNCIVSIPTYPAIKICKLAVHEDLHGIGVGNRILDLVIGEIVGGKGVAACRILITDAVNEPKVIEFYGDYGFLPSVWAKARAGQRKGGTAHLTIKMIRDIYA